MRWCHPLRGPGGPGPGPSHPLTLSLDPMTRAPRAGGRRHTWPLPLESASVASRRSSDLLEGLGLGDDVLLEEGRVVAEGRALGHVRHLVNAHHEVLGGVHLLEVLEGLDGGVQAVPVQAVQQRVLQQRRRLVLALHVVPGAVDVGVDGARNARDVRHLGQVIAPHPRVPRGPHQHVVRQVADHLDGLLLVGHQALAQQCEVLVVPGVAVRNGGAVGHARDLVPVVPPGHHAGILGGVVAQPPVGLPEVVDDHRGSVAVAAAEHDLRLGEVLRHLLAVGLEVEDGGGHARQEDHRRHLAGKGVVVVRLDDLVLHELHLLRQQVAVSPPLLLGGLLHLLLLAGGAAGALRGGACLLRDLLLLLLVRLGGLLVDEVVDGPLEHERREGARADGARGAQNQNQPHHLAAEVGRHEGVGHEEPLGVGAAGELHTKPEGGVVEHVVEVQPVRIGAGRLMLSHGVHERVAGGGVLDEERAHAVRHGAEEARGNERLDEHGSNHHHDSNGAHAEGGEGLLVHLVLAAHDLAELQHLDAEEDAEGPDLLHVLDGLGADDGELHHHGGADHEEDRVGVVQAAAVPPEPNQQRHVHPDHVQHEGVPAPREHHVDVAEGGEHAIHHPGAVVAQRAHPAVEGQHDGRHRH
mmetsp:Transcript_26441/g.57432  ORF Transcript_26441/g.57432 Transcript_26441/m.57432 type:complete len:638 (+) Transcript_26441:429-2342(+)